MSRFVIIVGESSGDQLARGLIEEIRMRVPDARFEGITGPQMRAAGCASWGDYEQLAVMGLFEVIRHLPRLRDVMQDLQSRLKENPPDVLIGVDAPDFNLRLEKFARKAGIPTVHYVSPSVWAWRRRRLKTIRAACDRVLCLLPFEAAFLEKHGISASFVGHPMADEIGSGMARKECRTNLDLADGTYVALLPGSRGSEIQHLGPPFLDAVRWLRERRPDLRFIAAAATPRVGKLFALQCELAGLNEDIDIREGVVREIIGAADVVLLSSGTATLETMLMRRPMVVAYKFNAITAFVARLFRLVNVQWFSLPNLLAQESLVPEFLQEQVTGETLGQAVLDQLQDPGKTEALLHRFDELSGVLRQSASIKAAESVMQLLESRR